MKPNSITILCLIKMLDKTYYIHKCAGTIVCFMSRQLVQLFVSCLVSWYNCLFHVSSAGTIVCFMSRQLCKPHTLLNAKY